MWTSCRFLTAFMTCLPILFAMPAHACPDCQDEQCVPVTGICGCVPRIGCKVSIPFGTKRDSIIPIAPVPLPPQIQELEDGLGKSATRIVKQLGDDTLTTIQNSAGDLVQTLQKANGDVIATLQKAGEDTVRTIYTAANDATVTYFKSWRDIGEQGKRSFDDAVDAGNAAAHYVENQAKSEIDGLDIVAKGVQDGKIIDAMWKAGTERLRSGEANFAKATQESTVINSAAASAAVAYGGPGGAAAYAAWSTYRQTGNADMALRAGLLAALSSQNGASVPQMPAGTTDEIFRKAAMAGAAGGLAAAAEGGDEQSIKDGFLRSSGKVLVQGGAEKLKAYSPKANDAYQAVQCISARDVDCLSKTKIGTQIQYDESGKPRIDPSVMDPNNYIGKWSRIDPKSAEGQINAIIAQTSKLPKTKAIPILKNKWVLTWTLGNEEDIKNAQPTVVLTYVGDKPPFISKVSYDESRKSSGVKNSATLDPGKEIAKYYARPADGRIITDALEKNSIKYIKKQYVGKQHSAVLSNALICGPGTRVKDLKKVAISLLNAGVDIKYIGTNSGYQPGQVSILNLQKNKYTANYPNIRREQVEKLKTCPKELKNG